MLLLVYLYTTYNGLIWVSDNIRIPYPPLLAPTKYPPFHLFGIILPNQNQIQKLVQVSLISEIIFKSIFKMIVPGLVHGHKRLEFLPFFFLTSFITRAIIVMSKRKPKITPTIIPENINYNTGASLIICVCNKKNLHSS